MGHKQHQELGCSTYRPQNNSTTCNATNFRFTIKSVDLSHLAQPLIRLGHCNRPQGPSYAPLFLALDQPQSSPTPTHARVSTS